MFRFATTRFIIDPEGMSDTLTPLVSRTRAIDIYTEQSGIWLDFFKLGFVVIAVHMITVDINSAI
jgi:hypothetical protein